MKKYLLLVLIAFSFVSLKTNSALAISGACASHFGVNCAAGMSSTGNVICNDGWIDSSVAYISADECMGKVSCTQDEYNSLNIKYGLPDKIAQSNSITAQFNDIGNKMQNLYNNKLNEVQSSGGVVSNSSFQRGVWSDYDSLHSQYLNLKSQSDLSLSDLKSTESKIESDCHSLGLDKIYKQNQDAINNQKTKAQNVPSAIINTTNSLCGWAPNSHPLNNNGCQCDSGYHWNSSLTRCLRNSVENASVVSVANDSKKADGKIDLSEFKPYISTSSLATNTPTSTRTILPKQKHWYNWINPFNWF